MANLSTNNGVITIMFDGLPPVIVDNFDPDSDMWTVNERQTAEAEMTPDGFMNAWSINTPIEATLTLSGGSLSARALRQIADANTRRLETFGEIRKVSVIVVLGLRTMVYSDGYMTSSKAGDHLGNQKLQNQPFNFKFGKVKG